MVDLIVAKDGYPSAISAPVSRPGGYQDNGLQPSYQHIGISGNGSMVPMNRGIEGSSNSLNVNVFSSGIGCYFKMGPLHFWIRFYIV